MVVAVSAGCPSLTSSRTRLPSVTGQVAKLPLAAASQRPVAS
jgi:hypothetical protein